MIHDILSARQISDNPWIGDLTKLCHFIGFSVILKCQLLHSSPLIHNGANIDEETRLVFVATLWISRYIYAGSWSSESFVCRLSFWEGQVSKADFRCFESLPWWKMKMEILLNCFCLDWSFSREEFFFFK